jgi:hypothetical protein
MLPNRLKCAWFDIKNPRKGSSHLLRPQFICNVVKTIINYLFGNGLYMFIPLIYCDLGDGLLFKPHYQLFWVHSSCPMLSVKDSHGLPWFPTRAFLIFSWQWWSHPSSLNKAMCFAVSRNWRTQTKGNSNPTTDEFPGISCGWFWG